MYELGILDLRRAIGTGSEPVPRVASKKELFAVQRVARANASNSRQGNGDFASWPVRVGGQNRAFGSHPERAGPPAGRADLA